jgi:hypothetical protein
MLLLFSVALPLTSSMIQPTASQIFLYPPPPRALQSSNQPPKVAVKTMFTNGDGSKRRRREAENAVEAESDRTKQQQYNRLSPTPAAPQHAQHIPLLMTQRSQEDPQDWEGGYGAVSATAPMPNYMTTPFGQPPQNYYPGFPAPGMAPPPYGQPIYQHHQWQPKGLPPPPPPPPAPFQQGPRSRNSSMSPQRVNIDSSLYYSDEDDVSPLPSPAANGRTPPMREVSTKTNDGRRSDASRPGYSMQSGRKSKSILKKVKSSNELQESAATVRTAHGHGQHRRNNSDFVYNKKRSHRRINSADLSRRDSGGADLLSSRSPLPLHPYHRKSAPPAPRSRASSAGAVNAPKPRHRRAGSLNSVSSLISVLSEKSVVSDISRSAFYKEKTSSGKVRFHAPTDRIRLVMDTDLEPGHLYRVRADDEEDGYIQYTLQSEDIVDFPLMDDDGCGCNCNACVRCQHKMEQMLLSVNYELRVPENLYQKVLGEISDSKQPCGLFFCGHHEDVDRPSISIAVVIVVIVFGALLAGTFLSHGG